MGYFLVLPRLSAFTAENVRKAGGGGIYWMGNGKWGRGFSVCCIDLLGRD